MYNPSIFKPITTDSKQLFVEQWQTLHNNHEAYENYALVIKLVVTTITLFAFAFLLVIFVILLILATHQSQEAIWKIFQQRTANTIITIEDKLSLTENEQEINRVAISTFAAF